MEKVLTNVFKGFVIVVGIAMFAILVCLIFMGVSGKYTMAVNTTDPVAIIAGNDNYSILVYTTAHEQRTVERILEKYIPRGYDRYITVLDPGTDVDDFAKNNEDYANWWDSHISEETGRVILANNPNGGMPYDRPTLRIVKFGYLENETKMFDKLIGGLEVFKNEALF